MKTTLKKSSLLLFLLSLPYVGFSAPIYLDGLGSAIDVISFANAILFISSIICIVRFFKPGDESRFILHVFNAVFVVVFYIASLTFLINHKNYFEGYETLKNGECIRKYFLSVDDFVSIVKKLILVAFVMNIIYIVRHRKTYYLEG